MKVYLVRNFSTKGILGIFWSKNLRDLWWEVDGNTDPGLYEYTILQRGGLYFNDEEPVPDAANPDVEVSSDDFDPAPLPWTLATTSEFFFEALYHSTDVRWKRFPFADEPGGGAYEVIKEVRERQLT